MFLLLALSLLHISAIYSAQSPPKSTECAVTSDVVFVMDGSGSVVSKDFGLQKDFILEVVKSFKVGSGTKESRFGAVQFASSNKAKIEIELDDGDDRLELETKVPAIVQIDGSTDIAEGIDLAVTMLSASRNGAQKVIVVLTDGKSDDSDATTKSADAARAAGIVVMSVGVGNFDQSELEKIANQPENVFTVNDFDALVAAASDFESLICTTIEELPQSCEVTSDVVFVMDGSGSVGAEDFGLQKDFILEVVKSFKVGSGTFESRFGAVQFASSNKAKIEIELDDGDDKLELETKVPAIVQLDGSTDIAEGIDLAVTMLSASRNGAQKVIVVLTDGSSNDSDATSRSADAARVAGISVMSVGVANFDQVELEKIADKPENVFTVKDFNALLLAASDFETLMCSTIEELPPPKDLGCGPGNPAPTGCDNQCGSTKVDDECGVCGGPGIATGKCDCSGNVDAGCGCGQPGPTGCDNQCGSTKVKDECGVCDGPGIATGKCDCSGNVDAGCGCGISCPKTTYPFLFDGCCRGGGASSHDNKGPMSHMECEALCSLDENCLAIETNGWLSDPVDGNSDCYLFFGDRSADITNGACDVSGNQKCFQKPKTTYPFLFDGCCRGGGASSHDHKGPMSHLECEALCSLDENCLAIETNGWRSDPIDGNSDCYLFFGDRSAEITNGACDVSGNQKCFQKACEVTSDVVFVMDGSGSIGSTDFGLQKDFILEVVKSFKVGSGPSESRFGVVQFASEKKARVEIELDDGDDKLELQTKVSTIAQIDGTTAIDEGIDLAVTMLSTSRDGAQKVIVVLTDGSSDNKDRTATSADAARAAGIAVMSVGVANFDQSELEKIADKPENVFTVADFDALVAAASAFETLMCSTIEELPHTCIKLKTGTDTYDHGDLSLKVNGATYLDDKDFSKGETWEGCSKDMGWGDLIPQFTLEGATTNAWAGNIEVTYNGVVQPFFCNDCDRGTGPTNKFVFEGEEDGGSEDMGAFTCFGAGRACTIEIGSVAHSRSVEMESEASVLQYTMQSVPFQYTVYSLAFVGVFSIVMKAFTLLRHKQDYAHIEEIESEI